MTTKPNVNQEEKKPKMGTGGRSSAGAVKETKAKPSTTVRLNMEKGGFARDSFWYLKHEGELEQVTAEASNEVYGITRIGVFPPSDAQAANGVIASISLDTVLGNIRGIQIKESTNTAGALYLQTGSKNIAKEGEPAKWLNEVNLAKPVSAQILSYVDSLIEKVE